MSKPIKAAWGSTQGFKTASAGVLVMLFQAMKLIWPDMMTPQWEEWVLNAIGIVGATGVIDKLWRNRKDFISWIKKLFKKDDTP